MDEYVKDGDISFIALTNEKGKIYAYEIFVAGVGCSGITVTAKTKRGCINKLKPYLLAFLDNLEDEVKG